MIVWHSIPNKNYFIVNDKNSFTTTKEEIITKIKTNLMLRWFKDKDSIQNLLNKDNWEVKRGLWLTYEPTKAKKQYFSNIHIVFQVESGKSKWLETISLNRDDSLTLAQIKQKIRKLLDDFNKREFVKSIATSFTRKDREKMKNCFRHLNDVLLVQNVLNDYNNEFMKSYLLKRLFEVEDELSQWIKWDEIEIQKDVDALNVTNRKLKEIVGYIKQNSSWEKYPLSLTDIDKEYKKFNLSVPSEINQYNSDDFIPSELYKVYSFTNQEVKLLAI